MNKKKILALCLIVCMLAIAVVGGTLAYFTDTDDAVNTFTAGNVEIDLTEAVVAKDDVRTSATYGDLIAVDRENDRKDVGAQEETVYDYGKLYPGQNVFKDPTIENRGSENAYVAAKIIVTDGADSDLNNVIGTGYNDLLGIQTVIKGGIVKENDTMKPYNGLAPVYGDDTYSVYQVADRANGTYTFYVFFENALVTGEKKVLFENITIPAGWDNEQMKEMKDLTIAVEAYATQEYGFANCYEAMTSAFPGAFNFS